ncbi:MAG: hypothetical protein IT382_21555 [Deltaproteobacteria bacterium]|nr:hypothetical protein [Deltaproteobacteria bacterium]
MSERPVTLELPNCAPTHAQASIVERSPASRLARAALIWGALWGAMFVCIFIPVLHFVLVPSLLVLGPVMGILRLREGVSLVGLRGSCPRCGVPRSFTASGRFKDGREIHCDGCGNGMVLRLSEGAPGTAR